MPLRKALLISICWICHCLDTAKERTVLTVTGFTTGEKVSSKSNPFCWWNPFATSLALNLLTVPSAFSLILNTHLHPIACLLGGNVTKSQVSFFCKASNSCCIASLHFGSDKACLGVVGSM